MAAVESCRGGATLSHVEPVELVSSGLRLRPWRIGDAPAVLPALRDPAIARWNPPDHPDPDLAVARTWVTNRGDCPASRPTMLAGPGEERARPDRLLPVQRPLRSPRKGLVWGLWSVMVGDEGFEPPTLCV